MTDELKTMEDIFEDLSIEELIIIQAIKAEAVKWVNTHRNKMWNWTEDTFMQFFNLTEKDLEEDHERI